MLAQLVQVNSKSYHNFLLRIPFYYLVGNLVLFLFLPTDLIKRLEEENKVNMYLCQEKLPKVTSRFRLTHLLHLIVTYINFCCLNLKELEGKKKYAHDLQKVADEPAMGQTDIDELNRRVRCR